jgi:menaquinone-9 beta-reductase
MIFSREVGVAERGSCRGIADSFHARHPRTTTTRSDLNRPYRTMDELPPRTGPAPGVKPEATCDVTVIGGGLAGKAASLQLARSGLRVVCIEPEEAVRQPVGESLDWSAPELLRALGLPMEDLIGAQMATWKRHVTLKLRGGESEHYVPSAWLAGPPFHVELRTLHVDRLRLDRELLKMTIDAGVTVVRDKVVKVERDGKNISSVLTAGGARFFSPWFIDASGFSTCLLAREFSLPAIQSGPAKVAIWTYFPVPETVEGTTLYLDPMPTEYLEWVWEIPVSPKLVSVGYVTTGGMTKAKREQGFSVDNIFRQQLMKFPRFEALLREGGLHPVNVTSFRSRVQLGVAGPNWLIAGEAAAMVDPITSNGVTAALRHAAEASALILKYRKRGKLPLLARALYSSRILQMAKFFNGGIEKIVYEIPVRNRIGMRSAGTVYTSPAWSMNVVYARMKSKGVVATFVLGLFLGMFRASAWMFYQLCKRLTPAAGLPN